MTRSAPAANHVEEDPYRRIRSAIAAGDLLPNERLIETELAETLGVARATVRSAIARLAQELLVERLPNRGARVRRISEKEVVELLEARAALESLLAERASQRINATSATALLAICRNMGDVGSSGREALAALSAELREKIVDIADQATAARLLDKVTVRAALFQHERLTPYQPDEEVRRSKALVDAIVAGDAAAAAQTVWSNFASLIASVRGAREGTG